MLDGPVFWREAATRPRAFRFFALRSVYVAALLTIMCTAWLLLAGTQVIRNVGDMARFSAILFPIVAALQAAVVLFLSALRTAAAVAQEKDRRTLVLLLLTRLHNVELVLGPLLASLLQVLVLVFAALPFFLMFVLLGGVSLAQVGWVFAVTVATALVCGSIGCLVGFWREKTFQTLAVTALILVLWLAGCEAVRLAAPDSSAIGRWATSASPARAILAASRPSLTATLAAEPRWRYPLLALGAVVALNGLTIVMVRRWNPSRTVYRTTRARGEATIETDAEQARAGHVDAQLRAAVEQRPSRRVWDNPVLWREVRTWAYGRRIVLVRIIYLTLFALAAAAVHQTVVAEGAAAAVDSWRTAMPPAATPLAALLLVSFVLVNALAVTAITTERDGLTLDLLLATDLTPREFIFGKLVGVLWVGKDVVLLPLLLCGYLTFCGQLGLENLAYVAAGVLVMHLFAATLGIHCGMAYAASRSAIGVSLGTVFFLFLGVATCILMMISLSGSFQFQMAPFLAFILGGGGGLYAALGARNPSPAIAAASLLLPPATFYAITSFLLHQTLGVLLVVGCAYGFATAAMLVPALYEFDIAMGRTSGGRE